MLIVEFGIDHSQGDWRKALAEGRRKWRRHQLVAAINDNPPEAAQYLSQLGYEVTWKQAGPPPEARIEKLGRF